jgi:hypothetical protein
VISDLSGLFVALRSRERLVDELARAEAAGLVRSASRTRQIGRLTELISWADERVAHFEERLSPDSGGAPQHAFARHGVTGAGVAGTSCGLPPVVAGAGVPAGAPSGMNGA